MGYIAGIVIAGLFFITLHYFTELKKYQKILVTAILLSIIFFAIGFNKYRNMQRTQMLSVVLEFNQGNEVNCDGVIVSNKNYSLSVGTYTFIGKKGTSNYATMISVSTCK